MNKEMNTYVVALQTKNFFWTPSSNFLILVIYLAGVSNDHCAEKWECFKVSRNKLQR